MSSRGTLCDLLNVEKILMSSGAGSGVESRVESRAGSRAGSKKRIR